MLRRSLFLAAIFISAFHAFSALSQGIAPTPPLGWNSWDAYGLTIDEADFRANTKILAGMRQVGWEYSVIDEGWYMQDPFATTVETRKYLYDANGLLLPVINRFPSAANGAGFKPLGDWVHAQGLKFGIHIIRGIPKQVVKENLPIADSNFHAIDAADTAATCPWDDANYGVSDTSAGQAYYDSMLKRYAGWGIDYIKVDCISDHPYRPTEIRQISEAIRKTGRPILLSLSPGPTNLAHVAEVAQYAQMWRISDDHWDLWTAEHKPGESEFPFGVRDAFDRLAAWSLYFKPDSWPDEDMLPEGSLTPHPGWGDPRQSRLTRDEQRTEFTLWAISRSPLIFGGNLTKLDDFSRSLMMNKEVIDMNQTSVDSGPVTLPANTVGSSPLRVWIAHTGGASPKTYLVVFNIGDASFKSDLPWNDFHLTEKAHAVSDVWNSKKNPSARSLHVELHAHACMLIRIDD